MIVDDRYLLLGSANIAFTSLDFHSEMCALVDSSEKATALRRTLFAEHLCIESLAVPESFEDGAQLFAEQAALNQELAEAGKAPLARVYPLAPLPVEMAASPDAF
jgi:phosphatidylserine/phosphatidylglycerophosphate/cardiolipin synthase-like enzyme